MECIEIIKHPFLQSSKNDIHIVESTTLFSFIEHFLVLKIGFI